MSGATPDSLSTLPSPIPAKVTHRRRNSSIANVLIGVRGAYPPVGSPDSAVSPLARSPSSELLLNNLAGAVKTSGEDGWACMSRFLKAINVISSEIRPEEVSGCLCVFSNVADLHIIVFFLAGLH